MSSECDDEMSACIHDVCEGLSRFIRNRNILSRCAIEYNGVVVRKCILKQHANDHVICWRSRREWDRENEKNCCNLNMLEAFIKNNLAQWTNRLPCLGLRPFQPSLMSWWWWLQVILSLFLTLSISLTLSGRSFDIQDGVKVILSPSPDFMSPFISFSLMTSFAYWLKMQMKVHVSVSRLPQEGIQVQIRDSWQIMSCPFMTNTTLSVRISCFHSLPYPFFMARLLIKSVLSPWCVSFTVESREQSCRTPV